MHEKTIKLLLCLAILLLPITFSKAVKAGDEIKEYTPNCTYEEYEKIYLNFYGSSTQEMAEEGNPADLMLDDGEELFHKVVGTKGKSCASCHGENGEKLKGVAAHYPKYDPAIKGINTIALQINRCRKDKMGAKPLKYESYDQLALTLYVKSLSNGVPINVSIDGPARPFYEKGKKLYYTRMGQWNFNCAVCHVKYACKRVRTNLMSPNRHHADHWPSYRLKWGKVGSLQRRIRGCLKNMRAERFKYQSEELRALELYLTYQSNGLPLEVPGMRM